MHCDKCPERPVTFIRYSGAHLCKDHFVDYYEKRVYREFRKQVDLNKVDKLVIAVSGGKDSMVALTILKDILGERRDAELWGLTIDEGIEGYRPSSIDMAVEAYEEMDIPYRLVSFEDEFGSTLDEMINEVDKNPCTLCGVLRRWCMNTAAKEIGADLLATGLNLDDTAQSILMNFCRGDIEKLSRLGPHEKVKEGLIPRVAPLRRCPEKETYLYALLKGIEIHEKECPYAVSALRGLYREVLGMLEENTPGTKYALLSSHEQLKPLLQDEYRLPNGLDTCSQCGEPSVEDNCRACDFLEKL